MSEPRMSEKEDFAVKGREGGSLWGSRIRLCASNAAGVVGRDRGPLLLLFEAGRGPLPGYGMNPPFMESHFDAGGRREFWEADRGSPEIANESEKAGEAIGEGIAKALAVVLTGEGYRCGRLRLPSCEFICNGGPWNNSSSKS